MNRIPLSVPSVGAEELALLTQCIDDNFVSSVGPLVTTFEEEFATYCGVSHAIAVSSGTAALHLACEVAGVGPGDIVAVSDFTFIASANAVAYTGAELVLVDSEVDTWNLDSELLYDTVSADAAAGRPVPRAIQAVHVLGHPAGAEPLLRLRDEFDIVLIEDAAEALGASYRDGELADQRVGSFGAMGAFSFNGNKIITSGGGGMVVTDDADTATAVRHLSTQAKLPGPTYEHDQVGFNYRMSNITAAVGLAQLRKLPRFLQRKHEITASYDRLLDPDLVQRPPHAGWATPSGWLYTVRVPANVRDRIIAELDEQLISCRRVWPPVRSQLPFRSAATIGGGVGLDIYNSAISLPSSVDLADDDLERVASAFNAAVRAVET